jgi:hypothetical protein
MISFLLTAGETNLSLYKHCYIECESLSICDIGQGQNILGPNETLKYETEMKPKF